MRINERDDQDATVLDLLRPHAGDFSKELFGPQIDALIEEGRRRFVLDLSDLPWIDSTSIGLLLGARRQIEAAGGKVVLTGINDRIKGIFEVVGMTTLWEVHPDVPTAKKALLQKAEGRG